MSCFQCDLDIPHTCYAGMPRARWGWTDEAVMHLEAMQRWSKSTNKIAKQPPRKTRRRR